MTTIEYLERWKHERLRLVVAKPTMGSGGAKTSLDINIVNRPRFGTSNTSPLMQTTVQRHLQLGDTAAASSSTDSKSSKDTVWTYDRPPDLDRDVELTVAPHFDPTAGTGATPSGVVDGPGPTLSAKKVGLVKKNIFRKISGMKLFGMTQKILTIPQKKIIRELV